MRAAFVAPGVAWSRYLASTAMKVAERYRLRAAAKEFKRGNYRTYYVLKWLAIAGLVWAIFW